MPGACYNGDCQNTLGSFECLCPKGFVRANGGKTCMGMYFLVYIGFMILN